MYSRFDHVAVVWAGGVPRLPAGVDGRRCVQVAESHDHAHGGQLVLEQIILISEYRANELFELQTARGPLKVTFRFTFVEHAAETRVTYTWIAHLSRLFRFTHPLLTR